MISVSVGFFPRSLFGVLLSMGTKGPCHQPEWPHPHTNHWKEPAAMELPRVESTRHSPHCKPNPFTDEGREWEGGRGEEVEVGRVEEEQSQWRTQKKN